MTGRGQVHVPRSALAIDDDVLIAWAIEEVLRGLGFDRVIVAPTTASARHAMDGLRPALIVCDLNLTTETFNGLEILRTIDPAETIPTLIYTGYMGTEIEQAVTAARPKAMLFSKPATDAALGAAIRHLLERAEQGRQRNSYSPASERLS